MTRILAGRRMTASLAPLLGVALLLTACAPEPGPTPSASSAAPAGSPSASAGPTPSATPTPTAFTVPGDCEAAYPAALRDTLSSELGPLNDPEITLYSTQIGGALEVLESGGATLRCTWGAAGGPGLATNVTAVDADERTRLEDVLTAAGAACEAADAGTICEMSTKTVDWDGNPVSRGESHFLGDGGWIATSWVGTLPEGYTTDMAAALWSNG